MKPVVLLSAILILLATLIAGANDDGPIVRADYHLTARPWTPLGIARGKYLDAIEGVCRFSIRIQNAEGAIIDPYLHREHQYATPYFAAAVATLTQAGRALDLLPNGIRAMEHATSNFAGGQPNIPDQHGNFFIAALTEALEHFRGHVPEAQWNVWRERMKTPRARVVSDGTNNWETYVMKGDWMRVKAGLAEREDVTNYIENAWRLRQHLRIADPPWRLYHDRTSDPETLSVETVGRVNLLALAHLGYDGPSAPVIRDWMESATHLTMWLQDPSGQVPVNGRTDNHVWVEVGYQLAFEIMAERMRERDPLRVGQYRRAAMQSFQSIQRWRRADGSFSVTKNHFDPSLRIGYQNASQYTNYNGSLMLHLAEAYHARQSDIQEQPTPSEIGGYAIALDEQFATAFANAGGMQMQVNLRGQTTETHGNRWTPLGVVRFARPGWDTRLGPSDGVLTANGGVSFAPTFLENGHWFRMADLSSRYEARWEVSFVHPLLVRCAVTYWPRVVQRGPVFRNEFVLTPDAILSVIKKASADETQFGVTWPILINDGTQLKPAKSDHIQSSSYANAIDRQNFIALDETIEMTEEPALRGSYGDLQPIRVVTPGLANHTLVYPSSAGDPDPDTVRKSFRFTTDGFESVLGRVTGTTYIGRTSAGGLAQHLDLDRDGKPEVTFSGTCGFVIRLRDGRPTAIEANRPVSAEIAGRKINLRPYVIAWLTDDAASP